MEDLCRHLNKIILIFFGIVFCYGILKQIFDPNFSKYTYFDIHCNGTVVSQSYDQMSHCNLIKLSDNKKIDLADLDIIPLIGVGDSIVKNKNVTYFTIYKKNGQKIVYDMHDEKLVIFKSK